MRMNLWPVIKVPLAVQLNRVAFALYAWFFWANFRPLRDIGSVEGTAIIVGMIFLCVLGFFYSFIRARSSRWIMAVLVILIPGLLFAAMCRWEWSWPDGWFDFAVDLAMGLLLWFGVPVLLAVSLFAKFRFSLRKKDIAVEPQSARNCAAYFAGSEVAPGSRLR